jgi:hypothetical protein
MMSKKLRYGLIVLCIAIAVGALWMMHRGTREGFQYRDLNVDYRKEVYLVGYVDTPANPDYSAAFTKEEAQTKCESFGATLASTAQLRDLKDIGANWCNAGAWVSDDDANLYFPIDPTSKGNVSGASCSKTGSTKVDMPGDTSTDENGIHIRRISLPTSKKGFAACYGVKPPVGEPGVQFLNMSDNTYSYFDSVAMISVMDGDGKDMIPFSFTPDQALYAMRQTRFNQTNARQYLIRNFAGNLNKNIREDGADPADIARDTADWTDAKEKSCNTLGAVYTEMKNRVVALKAVIAAVQGQANGTYYAKKENMNLQREIGYVCMNLSAEGSPACKRLASIDYEMFYKNGDTTVLANLEDLNNLLTVRECEIQRSALKMQTLLEILKCPVPSDFNDIFGNYKDPRQNDRYLPDTNERPICDLQNDKDWGEIFERNGDTRFTIRKNIGYVNSESLKLALEEISPFFAAAGFSDLFNNTLLNQLSILIRMPTFIDPGVNRNLKSINNAKDSVLAIVNPQ